MFQNMKQIILVYLCIFLIAEANEADIDIFPMPHNVTLGTNVLKIKNPCTILYKIQNLTEDYQHIQELVQHYQLRSFGCQLYNVMPQNMKSLKPKNFQYFVSIKIKNPRLQSVYTKEQQKYILNITKTGAQIITQTYVGFVRAIQTFLQTLKCSESKNLDCDIEKLPIFISDQPQFPHRGIMIDTAHHYLPIHLIYQTIDGMMYNKMNVLHWHITDDDSFPLVLNNHPELAKYGAFEEDEVYTPQDVKKLVKYAMIRGVRIVPQLATPAHSSSWVKAKQHQNLLACKPKQLFDGGFNTTQNATLTLVKEVFEQILQMFPDKMIHLGGVPLQGRCFNYIEEKSKNLEYRKKQKQIMKQLDPNREYIYWQTNQKEYNGQDGDVIHWIQKQYPKWPTKNKVIITEPNIYRLDNGVGLKNGNRQNWYTVWTELNFRNLKQVISNYHNKNNVLGQEVLLWSDTSNQYTHHIKLWIRSSIVAERLWNGNIESPKPGLFRRVIKHQRIMNRRGIPSAPITGQICEKNPTFC